MTTTIYVPCDTTALSLGADRVAQELLLAAAAQNLDVNLMRNGSRGLFWLEPLIEVQTPYGRVAYGPVEPDQVEELVVAGLFEGHPDHPLYLGDIAQHPYLQQQQRLTFARIGITDPICIEDYIAHGGFAGLKKAAALSPQGIVDEVKASGLRGRGGAAFPAGIKWQTVLDEPQNQQKYVVCNADEGDSGTFADRLVMECDPYMLIEGMAIAGLAVGATLGFIYVRSEYLLSKKMLDEAIRAHPVLAAAAQPRRFSPLLVSRTQDGGTYGLHVDNPFMGTGEARLRTDLSFTLFLSEPDSYEGGELEINHAGNTHHAKAPAGDLVLYPSTSLHQVRPVTAGQRIVCVGWIESSIRDAAAREILFDLENLRATLGQTHDVRSPEYLTLSKSIANLMRLWGEA